METTISNIESPLSCTTIEMILDNKNSNFDFLYGNVSNYDKTWTEEIKSIYHRLTISGNIVCENI